MGERIVWLTLVGDSAPFLKNADPVPSIAEPKASVHGRFCVHRVFDSTRGEHVRCDEPVTAKQNGWLCWRHDRAVFGSRGEDTRRTA